MGAGHSTALRGLPPFSPSLDAHNAIMKSKFAHGRRRLSQPPTVLYDPDILQRLVHADRAKHEVLATLRGLLDAIVVSYDGDVSLLFSPRLATPASPSPSSPPPPDSASHSPRFSRASDRQSTTRAAARSEAEAGTLPEEELHALFAPFERMCFANVGMDDEALLHTHIPVRPASSAANPDAALQRQGEEVEEEEAEEALARDVARDEGDHSTAMRSIPALHVLSHHPYLVSLDLSFNQLTGVSVVRLVRALTGDVAVADVDDAESKSKRLLSGPRASSPSPLLRRLSLAGNAIGQEGCAALAEWLSQRHVSCPLEVLSLFHCSLQDEAVRTLLGGLATPAACLRVLDLNYNHHKAETCLTLLKEAVLPVNPSLAVVCVESVRYDPELLQACPVEGEKRLPQACTPEKGGFRPVTEDPHRLPHGLDASGNTAAVAAQGTAEESERAMLRRRFLNTNMAGIAPAPHSLLDEVEALLAPRREAYARQQRAARDALLANTVQAAQEARRLKRNGGLPSVKNSSSSGSLGEGADSDAADSVARRSLDGSGQRACEADEPEAAAESVAGRTRADAQGAALEEEIRRVDSEKGRWDEAAASQADARYHVVKSSHRVVPAGLTASQAFVQRMARMYSRMESPERLAAVMADAYAFRDRRQPPHSSALTFSSANATAVPAARPQTQQQRLMAQGEIRPFRYPNSFDVILEMPVRVAKQLRLFDPSVLRAASGNFHRGIPEGVADGDSETSNDAVECDGALDCCRLSCRRNEPAFAPAVRRADRGGAVRDSEDEASSTAAAAAFARARHTAAVRSASHITDVDQPRRLDGDRRQLASQNSLRAAGEERLIRAATHDLRRPALQSHLRHGREAARMGSGVAIVRPPPPPHPRRHEARHDGILISPSTRALNLAQDSARATSHRQPHQGPRPSFTRGARHRASFAGDHLAGGSAAGKRLTTWRSTGVAAPTTTTVSPPASPSLPIAAGGVAGDKRSAVAYFTAPHQRCAAIVDDNADAW